MSTFGRRHDAERSKNLANIFHMAQAIAVSVPLIFINLTTLMNVFRVPGEEHVAFDIGRLTAHTGEGTDRPEGPPIDPYEAPKGCAVPDRVYI